MKSAIILLSMATTMIIACGERAPADAQDSPRAVAEAIFNAAKTGKTNDLAVLIDVDADGDSKMIAQAATDKSIQEEFQKYFANGKVAAEPIINGEKATVDILFGPDGTKEETFEMVKKGGKWYLLSF